jgi:hypothetical protein
VAEVESRYASTKIWAVILGVVVALVAWDEGANWNELNKLVLGAAVVLAFVAWLDWMDASRGGLGPLA